MIGIRASLPVIFRLIRGIGSRIGWCVLGVRCVGLIEVRICVHHICHSFLEVKSDGSSVPEKERILKSFSLVPMIRGQCEKSVKISLWFPDSFDNKFCPNYDEILKRKRCFFKRGMVKYKPYAAGISCLYGTN